MARPGRSIRITFCACVWNRVVHTISVIFHRIEIELNIYKHDPTPPSAHIHTITYYNIYVYICYYTIYTGTHIRHQAHQLLLNLSTECAHARALATPTMATMRQHGHTTHTHTIQNAISPQSRRSNRSIYGRTYAHEHVDTYPHNAHKHVNIYAA